jgi:Protein of unknown function (DUF2510)
MTLLSEQPPPRKRGAKAGYYPDPLGSGRARYWDGANWTHQLGPLVEEGAAKGTAVPPPTKVCRHCGAQSETFDSSCPSCGKAYQRSTGLIIGIVAACLGSIVLLGGCAVLFAVVVDDLEIDDGEIEQREFESVKVGDTEGEVRARLGDPSDTSEIEDRRGRYRCLYYDDEDEPFEEDAYFEFCFIDGKLFFKRDYS